MNVVIFGGKELLIVGEIWGVIFEIVKMYFSLECYELFMIF